MAFLRWWHDKTCFDWPKTKDKRMVQGYHWCGVCKKRVYEKPRLSSDYLQYLLEEQTP